MLGMRFSNRNNENNNTIARLIGYDYAPLMEGVCRPLWRLSFTMASSNGEIILLCTSPCCVDWLLKIGVGLCRRHAQG